MIVLKSGLKNWLNNLVFSPDGQSLAVTAGSDILLWNDLTGSGKPDVLKVPSQTLPRLLLYTPDGEFLVTGDRNLFTVRVATRETTAYPIQGTVGLGFAPTPDSAGLVVCRRRFIEGKSRAEYTRWSLQASDKPEWIVADDGSFGYGPLFGNAGPFLVLEFREGKGWCLAARSATTGELLSEVAAPNVGRSNFPDDIVLSPDATLVAFLIRNFIHIQPVRGPFHEQPDIRNDSRKHFTGIAFHPSGRYLAATSNDATVKLYDTATRQLVKTYAWDIGKLRSVDFSPDGTLAAAGSDKGKVVIWDVDL